MRIRKWSPNNSHLHKSFFVVRRKSFVLDMSISYGLSAAAKPFCANVLLCM